MKKKITSISSLGILLRVILRVGALKRFSERYIISAVSNPARREKLNDYYNQLDFDEKSVFHTAFSKIFKDKKASIVEGNWTVKFSDSQIKIPLRNENLWLDWNNAVSIAGHDIEVKSTYEALLESAYRPKVFFDVGANYGTHSLIFLTQGVSSLTFEPNPFCRKEFGELCEANDVNGKTEDFAVGEKEGTVNFWFPEEETWLGTVIEEIKDSLSQEQELEKMEVSLVSLDSYTSKSELLPDLIKIDTEGNEINVIRGAKKTIETAQPFIIFESNTLNDKKDLWAVFQELNYEICMLPLPANLQTEALKMNDFLSSADSNFMALPAKHPIIGG